MIVQEPIQAAVWQCLNHYNYSDAIFLAERLFSEVCSDDALFLLATCYYRSGKPKKAYTLLKNKGCPSPQCRFLMARCCLDINNLSEAESAVCGNLFQKPKSLDEVVGEFGESAPFTLSLLGKIYSKTERCSKAIEAYRRSLRLNSFLWSSYETLCNLGEKPDPAKTFQTPTTQQITSLCNSPFPATPIATNPNTPVHGVGGAPLPLPLHLNLSQHLKSEIQESPVSQQSPGIHHRGFSMTATQATPENIMNCTPEMPTMFNINDPPPAPSAKKPDTLWWKKPFSPISPSFGVLPLEATPGPNSATKPVVKNITDFGIAHKKPMTRRQTQLSTHNRPPPVPACLQSTNNNINTPPPSNRDSQTTSQGEPTTHLLKSSRLSASSSSVKENNNKAKVLPKAPTKKRLKASKSSTKTEELNELNKEKTECENKAPSAYTASVYSHVTLMQKQSAEGLMVLLQDIARAYQALAQYDCQGAIEQFERLPPQHFNTGWVLMQVGRAYFEMNDYQKAEKVFQDLRRLEAHHIEGLEIYSTALWQLQKEVPLSLLAHELSDLDKVAPQTWCAVGNCFSLQREHDSAIKFLQRAVQVDPEFAYAYTLLGHEYLLTEELEKALSCFRNAVRVDARHYNAWYGIGMIYYKQEKFSLAEVHYRKALTINPNSSVLLCHIGVVQHALKKSDNALQTLEKALHVDPRSPLCKFHRASILFANDKYQEALKELGELKELVPKESIVYFLIGKVHKKLGNTHLALMNFSWAMDLDPKGANNNIKEAIDKRYVTDEDELSPGLPIPDDNDSSLIEADESLQAIESDESL